MFDFTSQISSFKNAGIYVYKFDEVGNEILNPSSSIFQQHFIAFPTVNYDYNNAKIQSFYNPTFTEFVPQSNTGSTSTLPQDIIDQINEITQRNLILSNQLDELIAKSEITSTEADIQLVRDTILTLRIQAGQGKVSSDFSPDFPYSPIPIDQRTTTLF
jgi:hypothetical protein